MNCPVQIANHSAALISSKAIKMHLCSVIACFLSLISSSHKSILKPRFVKSSRGLVIRSRKLVTTSLLLVITPLLSVILSFLLDVTSFLLVIASGMEVMPSLLLVLLSQPEVMSCLVIVMASRPEVMSSLMLVLTSRPIVLTTCPTVLTTCPIVLTSRPIVITSRPIVLTSCPIVLTARLKYMAAKRLVSLPHRVVIACKSELRQSLLCFLGSSLIITRALDNNLNFSKVILMSYLSKSFSKLVVLFSAPAKLGISILGFRLSNYILFNITPFKFKVLIF